MAFDLNKVPFYKAVKLFESEQYQEAFEIFALCAEKGNLYAVFYVEYLLNNHQSELTIPEKHQAFLKVLQETIQQIPRLWKPEAWCQASVCIIKIKRQLKEKKQVEEKLLSELESHCANAPNAALFYFEHGVKINPKSEKVLKAMLQLMVQTDLFAVYHVAKNPVIAIPKKYLNEFLILIDIINKESAELDKSSAFSHLHGGNIERLFSKYYAGTLLNEAGTKVVFKSPFVKKPERKLGWQKTGALHGNKELQMMFYKARHIQDFTEISVEEASQWLFMAARNGDALAQIIYGNSCLNQENYKNARFFLEKGLSVKGGSAPSSFQRSQGLLSLGKMQEEGLGGFEKDDEKALKLYQEAREYATAFGNIALFFRMGRGGLKKDYLQAVTYFKKAIEEGAKYLDKKEIADYYFFIGSLYREGGYGLKVDLAQAATHYRLAMDFHVGALTNYAVMLYHGLGLKKDLAAALKLMVRAADQGVLEAACQVITAHVKGEIKNPVQCGLKETKIMGYLKLLQDSVEGPSLWDDDSNDKDNHHYIAGMCYLKHLPSGPDYKNAMECFTMAARNNNSLSMVNLGYIYEHGCKEENIPIDLVKAFYYYDKAAALGDPQGLNNKAYFLAEGYGVAADPALAKMTFEEALRKGSKMAAYGLGCMYYNGKVIEKDHKRAFEYFKIAEETQDEDVYCSIAVCHQLGHGTPLNLETACHYYALADKGGHRYAGYNYAWIKIANALQSENLEESLLKDALSKLELGVKLECESSIYLDGMVRLLLDPSKAETIVQNFKIALTKKPHPVTDVAFKYISALLQKNIKLSRFEVLTLMTTDLDPFQYFESLNNGLDSVEQKENREATPFTEFSADSNEVVEGAVEDDEAVLEDEDNTEASAAKPETALEDAKPLILSRRMGNGTNVAAVNGIAHGSSATNNEKIASSKLQRLKREMDWFIDPSSKKSINIKEFKRLLGKISLHQDLHLEILPSKGSNIRFSLSKSESNSTLSFSYHPTHASGRGQDAGYDPGRAQSLQDAMKEVRRRVFE